MNDYQERLCREQGLLFELSAERFSCASSWFIDRFMHSQIAKRMDKEDPFGFEPSSVMADEMEDSFPSLKERTGQKYPEAVLHWIGYVYRYWAYTYEISSKNLFLKVPVRLIADRYELYHSMDVEYVIERIIEEDLIVFDTKKLIQELLSSYVDKH